MPICVLATRIHRIYAEAVVRRVTSTYIPKLLSFRELRALQRTQRVAFLQGEMRVFKGYDETVVPRVPPPALADRC